MEFGLRLSLSGERVATASAIHKGCRQSVAISVRSLSPFGERVGVRGLQNCRETLTPHPTPLPMGERIDMQRQKILLVLQLFMLTPSPEQLSQAACR
jgi:hypothetical protein